MKVHTGSPDSERDALFLGWQRKMSGEIFPLFNIIVPDHPYYRSTVTKETLHRLSLRVPPTSSPYSGGELPAPWHRLGIELNQSGTAREAIETAGLNYTVEKRQFESKAGLKRDAYVTVRTDTGEVLGVVNKNYEPVQNVDAFAFFDALIAREGVFYESVGILGRGERMWILARLPGYINVHGNDIVNNYLLLINSHDGSTQIRARVTPIRVVCNNTLTAALQGSGDIPLSHGPQDPGYLEQAGIIHEKACFLYEQLERLFNDMAAVKITDELLREYVRALVPDNKEEESDARIEKIQTSVLQLHEGGHGASLARGTLWGAFNSVVEYADHMMLDEDPVTQLNSIWFGRGEQLKSKAFRMAGQLMRLQRARQAAGEELWP